MSFNHQGSLPIAPFDTLIDRLISVKESVGIDEFLKIVKSIRSNYINYLSGNPERDPKTKCTKDGIPIFLGDLIPIVRGKSLKETYMILTILYSTRSLKTKANPSIVSITQPFTGDVTNLTMFMKSFWRELGYKPNDKKPKLLNSQFEIYRTKSGPNGHSLRTSISDARALPDSLIQSLAIMGGPKVSYTLGVALKSVPFLKFLSKYVETNVGSLIVSCLTFLIKKVKQE